MADHGKQSGEAIPTDSCGEKHWEDIALAITQERDSARVLQLCKDLTEALDKENAKRHPRIEAA